MATDDDFNEAKQTINGTNALILSKQRGGYRIVDKSGRTLGEDPDLERAIRAVIFGESRVSVKYLADLHQAAALGHDSERIIDAWETRFSDDDDDDSEEDGNDVHVRRE